MRLRALAAFALCLATTHSTMAEIPETPNDARIVRSSEELTATAAQSVAFGTEAPFFNAMGMETVVLGPGSIDQAHQPDEHLDLGYVQPAVELIKSLVQRFCLQ